MTDIKVQIGNMIRQAREKKGLTLKELGEKIGSSESTVSRYEKGKINISLDTLTKITQELDCSISLKLKYQ
ncbi:helix-turn-helix transcriptional regulator [Fibrella sp. ES10-3-2-2]|nr:transcriptional regulator [Fibrella sp. ES10-3-2-2]